jgi:hypothetical protein
MSEEMWLRFHEATAVVRQRVKGSIGRSQALVRAASLSGEVRSLERGAEDFSQPYGSRAKKISVLNKDDLVDWLNRHAPPPAAINQPTPKPRNTPQHKRERAAQALRALWPNGVPAATALPSGLLCRDVQAWIDADCNKNGLRPIAISDHTILRAAGRKGSKGK